MSNESVELEAKIKQNMSFEIDRIVNSLETMQTAWERTKAAPLVIDDTFQKLVTSSRTLGSNINTLSKTQNESMQSMVKSSKTFAATAVETTEKAKKSLQDLSFAELKQRLEEIQRSKGRLTSTEQMIQKEKELADVSKKSSSILSSDLFKVAGGFALAQIGISSVTQAFNTVTGFIKTGRTETQNYIRTQAQLRISLGYLSIALDEQADALGRKLKIDNDEVSKIQALLSYYTKDEQQIRRLTQASYEMAAVTGSAQAAASILGRSIEGNDSQLSRYGIHVKETNDTMERTEAIIDAVHTKFKDADTAIASSRDLFDKLSVTVKNAAQAMWSLTFNLGQVNKRSWEESTLAMIGYYEKILANEEKYSSVVIENAKKRLTELRGTPEGQEKSRAESNKAVEEARKIAELTTQLQEQLWEKTDEGKKKLLQKQMEMELSNTKLTAEQRKLIDERYAIDIQAINDKINKEKESARKKEESDQIAFNKWLSSELSNMAKEDEDRQKQTLQSINDARTMYYEAQFALIDDEYLRERSLLQLKLANELADTKKSEEEKYFIREKYRLLSLGLDKKEERASEEGTDKAKKEERKQYDEKVHNAELISDMSFKTISDLARASKASSAVQKGIDIAQATANTAIAVTKSLSTPWMIPFIIAMGTAQVALISQQKYAGGGVVGGGNPSQGDTVPALLTPGEMVLNGSQQASLWGMLSRPNVSNSNSVSLNINVGSGGTYDMNAARYTVDQLIPIIGDALVQAKSQGRLRDYEAAR